MASGGGGKAAAAAAAAGGVVKCNFNIKVLSELYHDSSGDK